MARRERAFLPPHTGVFETRWAGSPVEERLMNTKNAAAIVTGGAGGLGQCIVRALGETGAHVVIAYRHSEEIAQAMAEDVRSKGTGSACSGCSRQPG